ncbi:Sucrose nonfermenting 4-like protein [Capsicum baccatum]|uniref:Sucrose nonfermenting 4-like protein n=1 Tax=Capsicum baccatum TaxID=33114 RepID=A0A2G2W7V1_CAPBA|nr:Sucrose nonfermenting 4-like protein [Capsicum baccatum]
MFGSGSDSGQNHTGVVGATILMPTRFVWPYGGRRVLLSGSFTRWENHIAMSPMEGYPTVFQVVCNLTPGHHQYKFFVDGEWRHDERQPFVSGDYGVVNTVFLPRETEAAIPELFGSDAPVRSNMDVDNDFLRLDAVPQISQAEIELSRQRISAFLSTHTAYELLPESGKVIALDVNLPVKQAFHVLYEQGISVAPLWDFCKGQFVGVLTAIDFILILMELCLILTVEYRIFFGNEKISSFFSSNYPPNGCGDGVPESKKTFGFPFRATIAGMESRASHTPS